MQDGLLDFGLGAIVGGLCLSAGWGLFWLSIASIGVIRRTCSWRVVLNSLAVLISPLLLAGIVIWLRGSAPVTSASFASGLMVMPFVLLGLGLRQGPDGQRVGAHMLDGIWHLKDELLGKHHGCGGCDHEHGGCG